MIPLLNCMKGEAVDVNERYALLLGIHTLWDISGADLHLHEHQVDVVIEYTGDEGVCLYCGTLRCPPASDLAASGHHAV